MCACGGELGHHVFGMCHELYPPSEKKKKPLRSVKCMIGFPCCCSCASLFLVIVLSLIGMRILIRNSGALGPFKIGVDCALRPIRTTAPALIPESAFLP